jgi:hypothetical protein
VTAVVVTSPDEPATLVIDSVPVAYFEDHEVAYVFLGLVVTHPASGQLAEAVAR